MMTKDDLKQSLESKFTLICFEDIETVSRSHSAVFKFFKQFYRPSYDNDHRLVLYSSHRPSQKILNHIQRAAAQHDVSNWFLLICCNYDVSEQLSDANTKHGYDDVKIQSQVVDLTTTSQLDDSLIADIDTLCPMPFGHLSSDNSQKVYPCCKFQPTVGNLNQNSFSEIFHNDQMTRLRYQMIRGQKPIGCTECWQTENKGTISLRQHYLTKYGSEMDHHWIDKPDIRGMTIGVSALCNFKCRICKPSSSTGVQVELIQHSDKEQAKQIKKLLDLTTNHTDKLVSQIRPLYQSLEEIHFLGGEPFLIPDVSELIDDIIASGYSHHMNITFNTNGSLWNDNIITKLSHFNNCQITLSIDDIDTRFEIQRGGNWADIKQNIEKFAQLNLTSNVTTKFGVTVNIQNIFYLDQLVNFARQLGVEIIWTYLESPRWANIDYMTDAAKHIVVEKYKLSEDPHLRSIATRIRNSPGSNGTDFIKQVKIFDKWRHQKFIESHREIYNAMSQSTSEVDH